MRPWSQAAYRREPYSWPPYVCVFARGFEALAGDFLNTYNGARFLAAEPDLPFVYADFARWFAAHDKSGKRPEDFTAEDTGPMEGPDPTYFQRLCLAMDGMRDAHIVSRVGKELARRDRVLISFGSGHLVKQRPVWEALFGPSRDEKPF